MIEIKKIHTAAELPNEWDKIAVSYFQRREFLLHCEKYNPCHQRYYLLFENSLLKSGAVVYTLVLDIFTFVGLPSPIKMQITGIPCSVSASGIICENQFLTRIIKYIHYHEKGFHLTLNLESNPDIPNIINGRTLPSVEIKNIFKDWNHYKTLLRSDYRRRFLKIRKSFENIEKKRGICNNFTLEMYQLYRDVLKRSKGKLETLSYEFFRNLPSAFCLTSFYLSGKLIGWYISTTHKKEFYFFLGGIDYQQNEKHQTYFNILAEIVKEGIQKGADFIDLGQTAEIPKLRLGGRLKEKRMIGFHSSKILNSILKKAGYLLEYKNKITEANTLKQ